MARLYNALWRHAYCRALKFLALDKVNFSPVPCLAIRNRVLVKNQYAFRESQLVLRLDAHRHHRSISKEPSGIAGIFLP